MQDIIIEGNGDANIHVAEGIDNSIAGYSEYGNTAVVSNNIGFKKIVMKNGILYLLDVMWEQERVIEVFFNLIYRVSRQV